MQELNLAYHYPIIYWNCACLIVDAGADSSIEENKSTDYGKIATAIANVQHRGITVTPPLINTADFGFTPDEKNNRIVYSLKAINGIGDDVVRTLINNRPYKSMDDFYIRMVDTKIVKPSQVIQLIKSGAFDEISELNRYGIMLDYFVRYVVPPAKKLTLSQFDRLMELNEKYDFIPQNKKDLGRQKYFKEYILNESFLKELYIDKKRKMPKCGYHDRYFKLDHVAMPFFQQHYSDESVVSVEGEQYVISEKKFLKEYDGKIIPLRTWLASDDAVNLFNQYALLSVKENKASGTIAQWEMESLSIYIHAHELADLQADKYGVVDFYKEPEKPEVISQYTRNVNGSPVDYNKFRIVRLAGTVIDKNKDKHLVTLLTPTGVVRLKFNKGQFLHYDRTISTVYEDGTKERLEKSWFTRGNKLLVCGFRSDDIFIVRKYVDTPYRHCCHLITDIRNDGTLSTITERVQDIE